MITKRFSGNQAELLCLIGFLFFSFAFFPGIMSVDSLNQLQQALTQNYDDWHPPIMAWVWRQVGFHSPEPSQLFLIQLGLFWSSLVLIIRAVRPHVQNSNLLLLIPLVGFLPPVFCFCGVLWKDVQLAFSLLTCFAILSLLHFREFPNSKRVRWIAAAVAFVFLFYGSSVRINGLAAAPVFCLMLGWVLVDRKSRTPRPVLRDRLAFATFIFALLLGGQSLVNRLLIQSHSYPIQYLEMYDLAKISCDSGRNYFPEWIQRTDGFQLSKVCEAYRADSGDALFFSESGHTPLRLTKFADEVHTLGQAWLTAVSQQPRIWAQHRSQVFLSLLRIGEEDAYYTYQESTQPNSFGYATQENIVSSGLYWILEKTVSFWFFKPWFYLLTSVAGLLSVSALWIKNGGQVGPVIFSAALWLSGLMYTMPYWLIVPASDSRYVYWLVVSDLVAWVLLLLLGPPFHTQVQNSQKEA